MSTLAVVLIVLVVVLLLLAAGGFLVTARRTRARDAGLAGHVAAADAALAAAAAQDKGWERTALESAARREWTAQRPGEELRALHLIEVLDRPGTDADLAVFRAVGDGEPHRIVLGRRAGEWYGAGFELTR